MNEIVKIDENTMTVSARDLHDALEVKTAFKDWFPRMCEYGFTEGTDFSSKMSESTGGRPAMDAAISIDMAKEICMIQRTEKGKEVRKYFLDLEKAWNTPEQVMSRALKIADKTITSLKVEVKQLSAENEAMKPGALFASAVSASETSILVRDFSKILRQNGADYGEKRLYKWLRKHGYILQNSTEPSQRAMEQGLFERIERTVQRGDLPPIVTSTTKITGKGQVYFTNKILSEEGAER
jgi:anti-repressor protein